ncbi:MAG: hypothetical protein HOO90_01065 [Methylotenera sp.]|uniref:hypothetical protein n=1 Tax=Methylotenera sp. TaxID=2051956 RepID=UPI00179892FB|nr:hypothetical protein [Methylotenera sp.]NOU24106.1 hypothetical protein [Methylotenera sp.]
MPLYQLEAFQKLVVTNGWQFLNKKRCLRTQEDLGWSDEQIEAFLLGIQISDFQKTVPNNIVNDLAGQDFVNADQYAVKWCEENMVHADFYNKETIEISTKIAIITTATGQLAGAVTFHFS